MNNIEKKQTLFETIRDRVVNARNLAYRSSNSILLNMYWEIGSLIVEDEQGGKEKAEYGKAVLKNLEKQLSLEFGAGFDERNLNNMRAFYIAFPIWNAVRTELSWIHNFWNKTMNKPKYSTMTTIPHDKYTVTLSDILKERDKYTDELNQYLKGLGYE